MMDEYYLGAPMFANPAWRGTLFTSKPKPADSLRQYSAVFNSVEGNNTFYGLPSDQTIEHWKQVVPDHFRFCFKIPRSISHDSRLDDHESNESLAHFLSKIRPLSERVGRILLQLPPSFDGARFDELTRFIQRLPASWKFAVEARHLDYFQQPLEAQFLALLREHDVSHCLFDTSMLHNHRGDEPYLLEAQRKKPKMPRRTSITTQQPMIRFVGLDELESTRPALAWLADVVSRWMDQGRQPFVFIHTPNDAYAPQFCRAFHELLVARRPMLKPLPDWPGESETVYRQQSLF